MARVADASASIMLTSGASGLINALLSVRALRSLVVLVGALVLLLLVPFRGRRGSVDRPKDDKHEVTHASIRKVPVVRVPATVPWRCGAAVAVDQDVAARRALAIGRVVQEGGGGEKSVREFSLLTTLRGDTLFTQSWTPLRVKIRGLIVLMHGLNEHSGRYSDLGEQLNANGYKVFGMDWIGHGGSDGLHAYVPSLDYAVTDLQTFLQKVLAENPGLPCFCFGHSTGAAIILKAVLDPKIEGCIEGVVLTSPAVGVKPPHPIFTVLAPVVSFFIPRFQCRAANKQGISVSRDPAALLAKYSDPLVYTGSIRVKTGYEILRISTYLQQNLSRLRVPFLVLHGAADNVTDPEASKTLHEEAASTDKTFKLYEGLLHDLLFEPEREAIMKDIIEWLNCRVDG